MKLSRVFVFLCLGETVVGFQSAWHNSQSARHFTITRGLENGKLDRRKDYTHVQPKTALQGAINPILSTIQGFESPIGSLAVLASVVLVHEAGHFLAAKNYGMKINEFSIGFGPKLFSFKGFKSKDSTEEEDSGIDFSLRLLPLGGYVAFPENYNRTLAFQLEDEYQKKLDEYNKSNGKESLLSRIFSNSKKDEEERLLVLQAEEEMKKANKNWWNIFRKEKVVKEKPFDPNDRVVIEYYDDPDYLQNRPWFQRAVVLSGGVVFNFILAFSLFFGSATIGPGIPKPVFEPGAVVTATPKISSPSYGILERGDIIIGINDFNAPNVKSPAESQQTISNVISRIRKTSPGETVHLTITSKDSKMKEVDITPQPINGEKGAPQSIGVILGSNFVKTDLIKTENAGEAAKIAASTVSEMTSDTASAFNSLFKSLLKGDGTAGQGISGPVGVIKMGSDVVSTNDFAAIVAFAAAISVNLAVVNSIPFPSLDGGQLVFVLSEAVIGRKIDQRVQEEINASALLLLLLVSLGSTFGDVGKLLR